MTLVILTGLRSPVPFLNVLRILLHQIRIKELVIAVQEPVIVFLVVFLLFEQLKRPNAPRGPGSRQ
jgi:hypothetical protein